MKIWWNYFKRKNENRNDCQTESSGMKSTPAQTRESGERCDHEK